MCILIGLIFHFDRHVILLKVSVGSIVNSAFKISETGEFKEIIL